jgi:hypothetical protein
MATLSPLIRTGRRTPAVDHHALARANLLRLLPVLPRYLLPVLTPGRESSHPLHWPKS